MQVLPSKIKNFFFVQRTAFFFNAFTLEENSMIHPNSNFIIRNVHFLHV